MRVPDGAEDFFRAVLCGGVAFRDGEVGAELALEVAHMAGGEELRAAADAEVQVGGCDLLEFDAEAFCFLLGVSWGENPEDPLRSKRMGTSVVDSGAERVAIVVLGRRESWSRAPTRLITCRDP